MTSATEHYRTILDAADLDDESLTIFIAAGASREEVAVALGADLGTAISEDRDIELDGDLDETSAYAIAEIPGGVVAVEHTGYADPSLDALRQVTTGGRSAAVVRSNIQAHYRFGGARDGQVVFDDDEFAFVDLDQVPQELRALAEAVHELEGDVFATSLAMAEVVTGLRLTTEDLQRVADSSYHEVPSLAYPATEA